MKVEKAFTIDGRVVVEEFQKGDMTVYSDEPSSDGYVCYFVNNKTGDVLFKQTITADMGQGMGYISGVNFVGVNK